MSIHIKQHKLLPTYILKFTGLPLGTIKGKSSSATNVEGLSGWGKTSYNKDSYSEPRGGHAAPPAPVTTQRLSGLDNTPAGRLPSPPCICLTTCCNRLREHQR